MQGSSDADKARHDSLQASSDALSLAREKASAAADAARAAELARAEMQSLLADSRRAAEAGEDALRHARADAALHAGRADDALAALSEERQRAEQLCSELLSVRVAMRQKEAEKDLALGALIDSRTVVVDTIAEPGLS